jgi:signal transduction histidine kinase
MASGPGKEGAQGGLGAELLVPALLHELKQPLTGVDAAASLIERILGPRLTGIEEWQLLRQQVARLAEVMSGYDELFHAGEGGESAFELGPVVARAVQLLAHRVRPLGRRFALVPGEAVLGYGSASALVHAVSNVLRNALDAVEPLEREARIELRLLSTPAGAEVRVSDDGPGIAAAVRAQLFEPRVSTKPPERGGGLGLYLSRRLMARFGGEVGLVPRGEARRLPWAATEFCISLPLPPARREP